MTDEGEMNRTVWMKGVHPVRIKSVLTDEMLGRLKALNQDTSTDEIAHVFASICVDRQYSDPEGWKNMLETVKNMPAFLKLFQEEYQ